MRAVQSWVGPSQHGGRGGLAVSRCLPREIRSPPYLTSRLNCDHGACTPREAGSEAMGPRAFVRFDPDRVVARDGLESDALRRAGGGAARLRAGGSGWLPP